jgi:hypothetical protein
VSTQEDVIGVNVIATAHILLANSGKVVGNVEV